MATTLEQRKVVAVAQVEKAGEKIVIPDKMTVRQTIQTLERFEAAQEENVSVVRAYEVFPWDGAYALNKVLTERYGWSDLSGWGATLVPVEVGYKKTEQVPWGKFILPTMDNGSLYSGVTQKRGRAVFQLTAIVKRKWEAEIQSLFDAVAAYLDKHSIYRGQAIEIDFDSVTDDGLVEPKFINIDIDPDSLILNDDIREDVENVVFTPIIRAAELKRHGISFRSMVVLAGDYGTGKTLTTTVAAYHAKQAGVFYLKIKRASQLAKGIEFCRQYEGEHGAVLQVEDVDRVTSGDRDQSLDDILNTVDGVDSKSSKVFVLATTNAVQTIHPAMLRNGRVRKVIFFTTPDAKSVEKLIHQYGKDVVDPNADLTEAGQILAGTKPATIADVVSLSKLAMLKRSEVGTRKLVVSGEAIAAVARTMSRQLELVERDTNPAPLPTLDAVISDLVARAVDAKSLVKTNGQPVTFKTVGSDKIKFDKAS